MIETKRSEGYKNSLSILKDKYKLNNEQLNLLMILKDYGLSLEIGEFKNDLSDKDKLMDIIKGYTDDWFDEGEKGAKADEDKNKKIAFFKETLKQLEMINDELEVVDKLDF